MIITVWELYTKQKNGSFKWEHNHIEDGYSETQLFPAVKHPNHKEHFSKGQWRKYQATLIEGKVIMGG